MKMYIVLNPARNEGYATNEYADALVASEGYDFEDSYSTLAAEFHDAYYDGEALPIVQVEI